MTIVSVALLVHLIIKLQIFLGVVGRVQPAKLGEVPRQHLFFSEVVLLILVLNYLFSYRSCHVFDQLFVCLGFFLVPLV
jgi:hypothetical protein